MNEQFREEGISLVFDLNQAMLQVWAEATADLTKRKYYKLKGVDAHREETIRSIYKLFLMIKNPLKKDLTESGQYNTIEKALEGSDADAAVKAFDIIDTWLYNKGVTKFDTKKTYDRTRAEQANKFKGY